MYNLLTLSREERVKGHGGNEFLTQINEWMIEWNIALTTINSSFIHAYLFISFFNR